MLSKPNEALRRIWSDLNEVVTYGDPSDADLRDAPLIAMLLHYCTQADRERCPVDPCAICTGAKTRVPPSERARLATIRTRYLADRTAGAEAMCDYVESKMTPEERRRNDLRFKLGL